MTKKAGPKEDLRESIAIASVEWPGVRLLIESESSPRGLDVALFFVKGASLGRLDHSLAFLRLGLDPSVLPDLDLGNGYSSVRTPEGVLAILVSLSGFQAPVDVFSNLDLAFEASRESLVGKTIWLPFVEPYAGLLSWEMTLEAFLEALRNLDWPTDVVTTIRLSVSEGRERQAFQVAKDVVYGENSLSLSEAPQPKPQSEFVQLAHDLGFGKAAELGILDDRMQRVQSYRSQNGAGNSISRSTALYAALLVDPTLEKVLRAYGFDYLLFRQGIKVREDGEYRPAPQVLGLHRGLRKALKNNSVVLSDEASLSAPAMVAHASIAAVADNPNSGRLGKRLAKAGLPVEKLFEVEKVLRKRRQQPEAAIDEAVQGKRRSVPVHYDNAVDAAGDLLQRRPFARILASRIQQARAEGAREKDGQVFCVNLHGRWGAGKTSVLHMLRTRLKDLDEGWVIVEFNAWTHQRFDPPWWPLIREVYRQSVGQLPFGARLRQRVRWWCWRFKTEWFGPASAVFAFVVLAGGWFALRHGVLAGADQWAEDVDSMVQWLAVTTPIAALVFGWARRAAFGSKKAVETFRSMSEDSLGPLQDLFARLTAKKQSNVRFAIFVDDLDRCRPEFVVALLEGIHTLFQRCEVTFVVSADRGWLRASFQKSYAEFEKTLASPGRPLGHHFIEKLFQLSVPLPRLSPAIIEAYWQHLLGVPEADSPSTEEEAERLQTASRQIAETDSPFEVQRVVESFEGSAASHLELRKMGAQKVADPAIERQIEHELAHLTEFLEPNPRAFKRLVNAYGLRLAVSLLEGGEQEPEQLARRLVLEQRWPALAEELRQVVGRIDSEDEETEETPPTPPIQKNSAELLREPRVRALLEGIDELSEVDLNRLIAVAESGSGADDQTPSTAGST